MVRTRADASARKAVAAKAPRKALGGGSSSGGAGPSSSSTPGKGKNKYAGGNPVCDRPIPDWQKSVDCFFTKSPSAKGKENDEPDDTELPVGGGSSSSSQGSSSSGSGPSLATRIDDSDDDD